MTLILCGKTFQTPTGVLGLTDTWWQAQDSPTTAILGNGILFDDNLTAAFNPQAATVTFTQLP